VLGFRDLAVGAAVTARRGRHSQARTVARLPRNQGRGRGWRGRRRRSRRRAL